MTVEVVGMAKLNDEHIDMLSELILKAGHQPKLRYRRTCSHTGQSGRR